MTGLDLISGSLRKIGVLASGESASASEAADAMTTLIDMVDGWSTQNLLIPNKVREVFALTAGQATYTLGSGANWNTTRPMKIENALLQIASLSPALELPMDVLTKDQYADIQLKGTTSTYPLYLYSDNAYPTTNVTVYPVPDNSSNNVVLYSWKPLSSSFTLAGTISLPPGYLRALRYNLSVELAPEYGRALSPEIVMMANESKADIKRMNFTAKFLTVDAALVSRSPSWNWRTGGPS